MVLATLDADLRIPIVLLCRIEFHQMDGEIAVIRRKFPSTPAMRKIGIPSRASMEDGRYAWPGNGGLTGDGHGIWAC